MAEEEVKIADLKNALQSWRDVLLPLHSILQWEKQWHPFSIVGCTTTFFMMLWLLEPSLLTTIALICLTITVSEFCVPHLYSGFLIRPEPWTEKHEQRYDMICRSIVLNKEKLCITYRSFCLLKSTRQKLYYTILISALVFMAWLGNNVDNMLLTYALVTFVCLVPGMENKGILRRYGGLLTDKIADMAMTSIKTDAKNKSE